jgi:hypothetical protein
LRALDLEICGMKVAGHGHFGLPPLLQSFFSPMKLLEYGLSRT